MVESEKEVVLFFSDRTAAASRLARELVHLRDDEPIVLGIPRGGVVTAFEVARALHAPLDVIMARKLPLPFHRDVAMGAVGEDGAILLDTGLVEALDVPPSQVELAVRQAKANLERKALTYRGLRPPISLLGRIVVIVDDGIATGWTMEAACRLARSRGAERIVAAAPMAIPRVARRLLRQCDELVVLDSPTSLLTIGQYYSEFDAVADDEVQRLLDLADQGLRQPA